MSSDSNRIEININNDNNIETSTVSVTLDKNNKEKVNHLKFMAVIKALIANIGIALVKLICFFFSSS